MGLKKVEIVDQTGENDVNGIVGGNSKPDNDRIKDPISKSKTKSNVTFFEKNYPKVLKLA